MTQEVKRIAEEGSLGDPVVLHADLSGDFDVESELYRAIRTTSIDRTMGRHTEDTQDLGSLSWWRCFA